MTGYEFSNIRVQSGLSIGELARAAGVSQRTIYRWEKGETHPNKLVLDFILDRLPNKPADQPLGKPSFKFIDLFAGIGGLRKGFESVNGKCVFTSEWDKASQKTYTANFVCDHPITGDIREIVASEIPSHDVLLAGFPCQPFSIAGVSKKNALGRPHGFHCHTQGTLFFEIAKILEYHRPAAFVLENVKNLLSHDKGNTFAVIKNSLEKELGYFVDWRVINAKAYLPQNRERIFIVGFKKDVGFQLDSLELPSINTGPTLRSILHSEDGSEQGEHPYTIGPMAKVADKYTLTPRLWEYLQQYALKHKAKGNGFGYGLFGPDGVARTLSARYYKDGSEILIRQKGRRPRRLTPRECARLMGFDIQEQGRFLIPVSDTQAYRQFGNSVAVPVVKEVAKFMFPYILRSLGYGSHLADDMATVMKQTHMATPV